MKTKNKTESKRKTPAISKSAKPTSALRSNIKAEELPVTECNLEPFSGSSEKSSFFVVGIGASAGGLEAIGEFFEGMPTDSGMAFVVIQHLSPDYKSFMVELLSKRTHLAVQLAEDGKKLEPNNIYLIPPKKNLKIFKERLILVDPMLTRGLNLPIDIFFRSLADSIGLSAVGVVLSGTGSDGTLGIRAIKEAGGMVMVQSQESAQFDGMPRSAIGTGMVDFILPPKQMAQQLIAFAQHPLDSPSGIIQRHQSKTEIVMEKIFALINERCGVDFSNYKPSTIDRRMERRMSINQLHSLDDYYQYLEESPREAQLLFNDLLISVTRFFRDADAFKFIGVNVIPKIVAKPNEEKQVRVWVPGCATGEEAYSIAIMLSEEMERQKKLWSIKVFATDIARAALDVATQGVYSESSVTGLPSNIMEKYFVPASGNFQVSNALRQMVVFARHDLMKDPPFTKMDIISCRNVLIYFQPVLQSKIFSLFQFALKPSGYLFLGSSEALGEFSTNFKTLNLTHKIFQINEHIERDIGQFSVRPSRLPALRSIERLLPMATMRVSLEEVFKEIIADCISACIVVDKNNEVLHLFGKAGEYLRPPEGSFTNNILKLTSHNLSAAIATAMHRASKEQNFTYDNVKIDSPDGRGAVLLQIRVKEIKPAIKTGRIIRVVYIDEKKQVKIREATESFRVHKAAKHRIDELEQELTYTKESLQATIEELETTNEELQATNEELLASNEELQATNEELQSVNEELHTVNAENQSRIVELNELNNDINNLLECANIGILVIDMDGRVRRISEAACHMTNLTQKDVGVPIEVVARNLGQHELGERAMRVMVKSETLQTEIQTTVGNWFLMRMVPYIVPGDSNKGCILTLLDITSFKSAEESLQRTENNLRRMMESPENSCLVVSNKDDAILTWGAAAKRMFDRSMDDVVNQPFHILRATGDDRFVAKDNMARAVQEGSFETEDIFVRKDGTRFSASIILSCLRDHDGRVKGFSRFISNRETAKEQR